MAISHIANPDPCLKGTPLIFKRCSSSTSPTWSWNLILLPPVEDRSSSSSRMRRVPVCNVLFSWPISRLYIALIAYRRAVLIKLFLYPRNRVVERSQARSSSAPEISRSSYLGRCPAEGTSLITEVACYHSFYPTFRTHPVF